MKAHETQKIHKLWETKYSVQLSCSDCKVNFNCLKEQNLNLNQRVTLNFILSQ